LALQGNSRQGVAFSVFRGDLRKPQIHEKVKDGRAIDSNSKKQKVKAINNHENR